MKTDWPDALNQDGDLKGDGGVQSCHLKTHTHTHTQTHTCTHDSIKKILEYLYVRFTSKSLHLPHTNRSPTPLHPKPPAVTTAAAAGELLSEGQRNQTHRRRRKKETVSSRPTFSLEGGNAAFCLHATSNYLEYCIQESSLSHTNGYL